MYDLVNSNFMYQPFTGVGSNILPQLNTVTCINAEPLVVSNKNYRLFRKSRYMRVV